jgi:hypothetical protein
MREREDWDEILVKQQILSKNNTFKTAFKATLGYYAARALVNFVGLGVFGLIVFTVYKLLTRS